MAARQPSASFADRDASRSHGPMMTERDEDTDRQRLAQVWNIQGPVSPGRFAARSHRIRRTHRVADNLSPLCVPLTDTLRPVIMRCSISADRGAAYS